MLPTLKRTITKSTLYLVEGTAYLCALCQRIAAGAHVTSTAATNVETIWCMPMERSTGRSRGIVGVPGAQPGKAKKEKQDCIYAET